MREQAGEAERGHSREELGRGPFDSKRDPQLRLDVPA